MIIETHPPRSKVDENAKHARHVGAPLHYERFSPPPVVDGAPFDLELARWA